MRSKCYSDPEEKSFFCFMESMEVKYGFEDTLRCHCLRSRTLHIDDAFVNILTHDMKHRTTEPEECSRIEMFAFICRLAYECHRYYNVDLFTSQLSMLC